MRIIHFKGIFIKRGKELHSSFPLNQTLTMKKSNVFYSNAKMEIFLYITKFATKKRVVINFF